LGDAEKGVFFVGEVAVRTFTDAQKRMIKEELRARFEVMIDAIATSIVPLD